MSEKESTSNDIASYKAWYASILHEDEKKVLKQLKTYKSVGTYIMALETCPKSHQATAGEHIHFLVEMNDKDFNAFRDWQKRHFNLKCKAGAEDHNARQFGKVKAINNLTKMAIYTVKHENVRTNMSEELLRMLVKQSYIKVDKKDEIKMMYTHLDDKMKGVIEDADHWLDRGGIRDVKKIIINKVLQEQWSIDLNQPTIDRIFRNWLKGTQVVNIAQQRTIFYFICI